MKKYTVFLISFFLLIFPAYGAQELPKLKLLIPGVNTRGTKMLENAKNALRYDPECTVIIKEDDLWQLNEIGSLVENATKIAIQKGKDVIVLVDMDLEHNVITQHWLPEKLASFLFHVEPSDPLSWLLNKFGTRWFEATEWAGTTINIVSLAFQRSGGSFRECEAHSAGVEAFEQSLSIGRKLFDKVNFFNGRTSVSEMASALKNAEYGWKQVNVFVRKGDLSYHLKSMSNVYATKALAGESWRVYYCREMGEKYLNRIIYTLPQQIANHSVLINNRRTQGDWYIYEGKDGFAYQLKTSVEQITGSLGSGIQVKPTLQLTQNKEGGVLFDKKNTYLFDENGILKVLGESISKGKPSKDAKSWKFQYKDEIYKTATIPLSKKKLEEKGSKIKEIDDNESVIVVSQDGRVFAFRIRKRAENQIAILEIAKGKLIEREGSKIKFDVERVIIIDYPVFAKKQEPGK